MIFEFEFTTIQDVHPWGESPNKSLSWFGFTDGKYRLKVGSEYLLNYSEEYTKYCIEKYPDDFFNTTFVEYQIVRLWEDILEMLPAILDAVPKELQHFLDSGYENYNVELASHWLNDRWLDSAYLLPSARIWIWSDETDVIVSWDNREIKIENIPVWSATQGNYRVNKEDFINEVRKFDYSLISQMNERVTTICQTWNKPEIKVDFEYLKSEQNDRATWFESTLNTVRKTDWNEVISAIKSIDE